MLCVTVSASIAVMVTLLINYTNINFIFYIMSLLLCVLNVIKLTV